MQKTKTFRFVDDQQSWDFDITYNLPSVRTIIDFERQRSTIGDVPNAGLQSIEMILSFVQGQLVEMIGPVTEVEEMPGAWMIEVFNNMIGVEAEDSEGNG